MKAGAEFLGSDTKRFLVQKRASRKPRLARHSIAPRFLQADFWGVWWLFT